MAESRTDALTMGGFTDLIHEMLKEIHDGFERRIAALEALAKTPAPSPLSTVTINAQSDGYTKDKPPSSTQTPTG